MTYRAIYLPRMLERMSDNLLLSSLTMADVYLPPGWPPGVAPPGTDDWEPLLSWLLGLVPDLRGHTMARRHPVIFAVIAWHVLTGVVDGARDGYRTA